MVPPGSVLGTGGLVCEVSTTGAWDGWLLAYRNALKTVSWFGAQALLTTRKQNKKFAVFDLKLTMAWEGTLVGEDAKVRRLIAGATNACLVQGQKRRHCGWIQP